MSRGSLLLVTLPPFRGGVPAKAAIMAGRLRRLGWTVTVAYYATLSDHPDLVVPSWRLFRGARPGQAEGRCWDDFACHAIGCRFPELEAPYTAISAPWRELVARHDRHLAIGGTPLVANILVECDVPHLLWCACPVDDDRRDRVEAMGWGRRLMDRSVVRPLLLAQQRRVLASPLCSVMGVSRYTCRTLAGQGGTDPHLLPIPTDSDAFTPPARPAEPGTIGFAGRLGDPRKRVPLLLEAVAEMRRSGVPVRLRLAGEAPPELPALAGRLGIAGEVEFLGHVPAEGLPAFYQSLDVFALPSAQEGLGIVGVEAMACGVPVVAAARGYGPDDYVIDGQTGWFSQGDAKSLAERIAAIVADRPARDAMSGAARALAVERFGLAAFEEGLADNWRRRWGDEP
ncbi:Putative glycosyltransferase [Magnetospirillum sp. XM-1]|uniref:glycosyltransferase family 4 protein n=1 Tax=Magnetospirillum sp. XM-1 TaxID=1663591 RepID=UPI00073DD1E7|nr:glycosyltransferase family 4 protein [Magnetospirillum sp. XM-1]CUW38088.1 Putative glycosyltransferase [Magnetospirillum sp. XM-1]